MAIISYDTFANDMFAAGSGEFRGVGSAPPPPGPEYNPGTWGSYIPLSEGYRAIDGKVIWAGTPFKTDEVNLTQYVGDGGLKQINYKSWNVKRACAYAFGYRLNPNGNPPTIRRLWVDGSLVYSLGSSQPVKYNSFQQTYLPAGQYVNGVWIANDESNSAGSGAFETEKTVWDTQGGPHMVDPVSGRFIGQSPVTSSIAYRFYNGSETQTPDQTILAALGSDAPSFRGMMYLVFDDMLVGQGNSSSDEFWPDQNVNISGSSDLSSQVVKATFPPVRVEFVDDGTSIVYPGSFLMASGSIPYNFDNLLVPNWDTGQLATIPDNSTGGGVLHVFDIETKTELYFKPITGAYDVGERVGGVPTQWDTVNGWFFTLMGFGSHTWCTIDANGAIISMMPNGLDTIDHNPATETNPYVGFQPFNGSALGYAVVNGDYVTVIFGCSNSGHGAALRVENDGSFVPKLYPHQCIDLPAGHSFPGDMIALPLWVHATKDQHLSYQDMCFLQTYGNPGNPLPGGARLVFVGIDGDGTTRIKGTQALFTGSTSGSGVTAVLDVAGNIILQEEESGIDPIITRKYSVNYLGAPDFSVAPGWRGLFPVVAAAFTASHATVDAIGLSNMSQSNILNNDLLRSNKRMNLGTLEITTVAAVANGLWDSSRGAVYYNGFIDETQQPLFGTGTKWAQVVGGLTGEVPQLKDVVKDISLAAGFAVGKLNIDTGMTEGVPGVLITGPYDLATLFDNMGTIYEFSYFNSGGQLTFRSSSNSPTYATGNVRPTLSSNASDGDTVTIGTITYRFKNTPSAPFDVQIGVNTSSTQIDGYVKTMGNLYAAIKGDATLGSFYAGTVANSAVTVKPDPVNQVTNYGYTQLTLTATVGGVAGNSVALAATGGHIVVSGSTLLGGSAPPLPAVNLTLDNLCFLGENQITQTDALVTTIPPPTQGQQAAAITYYALEQDYSQLTQTFTPDNLNGALPNSNSTASYLLPIVMSTTEAYARISHVGLAAGSMVITQDFRLPQSYMGIEPNDVLGITIPPFQYTVRVDEATFNGDFSMSISATNFSARTDVPINNSDSRATVPQSLPGAGDALPLFIDAPVLYPLQGTMAGVMDFTVGVRPFYSTFTSASFSYAQGGGGMYNVFNTTQAAKWGKLSGSMPAFVYPGYVIEETSITIQCNSLDFTRDLQAATSDTTFIAGENCVAVGKPGNWEYIYFRDVTQLSAKVVKLTGLIRAQRGTDVAAANHGANEYVVLLASANPSFATGVRPFTLNSTAHNLDYTFSALGSPTAKPPFTENDTAAGLSLYPFAPTLLSATLAGGNDLNLAWVRRDRLSTAFVASPTLMSETSEKYDVEIMNGTTVVRTLTDLTSPAYTYTSANQTTDGFTPPLAAIKFRVYQKGELGRGFVREETVNVH